MNSDDNFTTDSYWFYLILISMVRDKVIVILT